MNAADWHLWITRIDRVRAFLMRANIAVVELAVVAIMMFMFGRSNGRAVERSAVADSVRTVLADSSAAIEKRTKARAPVLQQAVARVETLTVRQHAAAARVQVLTDTTLLVDDVPVLTLPPIAERIRSDDALIRADSIALHIQGAQLTDVTADRDTWKRADQLDAANKSRFGFKSGVAVGVAVVLTLVKVFR